MSVFSVIALLVVSWQIPVVWPTLTPTSRTFPVDLYAERITIDQPLTDRAGRVVYHFACRGGTERYLDALPGNWVGPLMCTLAEGDLASDESLLSEDDSPAWFSRGQFRAAQLSGACARYPEYGLLRTFRLRGFRLTLEARDVLLDSRGVARAFNLSFSLVDDPAARGARAEQPGFLNPEFPGLSCNVVSRGNQTRMCRGAGLSWEPCKEEH
jgi:hypothetical protein